ncbi:FecCD family ABC transporter permease [Ancylobacter sp. SL191]|uniref:FecCD family ABC transporter permease n=1 Tax=Ancylobacter sp. SL191 TaxID=2995166 RepID=UPI002271CBF7|nr:iron ABC transporter permease [Ancylobacter sp. SL191]WAC26644.1 iron ABC transporter permease [Ancylobacter sp. SL191]
MRTPDDTASLRQDSRSRSLRGLGLALAVAALPVLALWALNTGNAAIPLDRLVAAVIGFDASREHLILWEVRLPRVLAGLLVGAQLAVAGAIMQAVTANPLASPGLLGINAGAAFAVVLAIALAGMDGAGTLMWFAFLGAGMAAVTVYALGSAGRGGATPLKLALAGAVLTAFLASLTTVILLRDQTTLDNVRLWSIGSLSGRPMSAVLAIGPWGLAGLVGAMLARGPIMTLSLGSDLSRALGQSLGLWRAISAALVVLLAGAAVALAGPVGFVGLVVPHMARLLVGPDYRWIIAYSAPLGAGLVLLADTWLRWLSGVDIPVGVMLALVGGPVFIALVRRQGWSLR